jgi:hypothetical protein
LKIRKIGLEMGFLEIVGKNVVGNSQISINLPENKNEIVSCLIFKK